MTTAPRPPAPAMVAPGQLATVVTHLEMRSRPNPRAVPAPFRLVRWAQAEPHKYRALFARVGAPWLWFSRLVLDDAALMRIIGDDGVEVYAVVDAQGLEIGMVELDFRTTGECEIVYLALIHELAGRGIGRWLITQTLSLAWRKGIDRVWLHTCTLDHPGALGFYRKHGFEAFAREVQVFADPRLTGHLPRDAAPHVPLL